MKGRMEGRMESRRESRRGSRGRSRGRKSRKRAGKTLRYERDKDRNCCTIVEINNLHIYQQSQ